MLPKKSFDNKMSGQPNFETQTTATVRTSYGEKNYIDTKVSH